MSRPNHVRNSDISCLISILKSFSESHTTEDDEGFEHPLSFYDDEATTNSGKTTDERPSRCAKKRWMWISALLLLLLVVLVSALASTKSSRANRSSASSMSYECPGGRRKRRLGTTVDSSKSNSNLPAWTLETVRRLDTEENDFVNIGCFRVEKSPDNRTVTAPTLMERAAACDAACSTNYFGLAWDTDDNKDRNKDKDKDDDTDTCYCYVDKPKERLSIGPCHRIDVVYDLCDDENDSRSSPSHRMEVFFDPHWNEVCSQETTSTVRNFLVEEDDVPFGFDIVTSEFRPSPFELYKDECGTNMYEVQTEVSQGSRKLTTTVATVEEDVLRRRGDLAGSIYGSRGIGVGGPFYSASTAIAGLADRRQTNIMRSSGAQEAGSSVFTSFGVRRLAEVKIVDFENKRDFVTFSPEFGALLRTYRQEKFSRETAQQIFRTYGMFVVTRGIFGGFIELRSTMLASDVLSMFSEREASRRCYEAFASIRAGNYGFYGNAPSGADGCGADAMDAFEAARREYELDTSEAEVVGGNAVEKELAVSPGTSTLLTSNDMYPLGDNGLELRPLTDFLSPQVISPLEIKRYQISEGEFAEIQDNLRAHLREDLLELEGLLDQCGDCEVPYFVQLPKSWGFNCSCYEPPPPPPVPAFEDVTPAPAESVLEDIAGNYTVQIRRRGEVYWGIGAHNRATMEIPLYGALTYDGTKVTEYKYDKERKFLSWNEHGDVVSRVEITFYTLKADESFFGDQPESTATHAFLGVIDDGWFAADEIRGFRVEE